MLYSFPCGHEAMFTREEIHAFLDGSGADAPKTCPKGCMVTEGEEKK